MDNKENEYKPCPFCGEPPQSGVEFYSSENGRCIKLMATIYCPKCKIHKGVVFTAADDHLVPFLDYEIAFDKAKKAWNQRVSEE